MIVVIHTVFGVAALLAGAVNLLARKGTRAHRRVGWIYALAMYSLLATSFGITEIYGGFGVFHVLALVSALTLTFALYFPLTRRSPHWMAQHYFWICYSYVGLLMATGSHLFERFPELPFLWGAVLFWGIPYAAGTALIFGRKRPTLARVGARALAD